MKKRILNFLEEELTFNVLAGYIWQCNSANLYFLSSGNRLFPNHKNNHRGLEPPKQQKHT